MLVRTRKNLWAFDFSLQNFLQRACTWWHGVNRLLLSSVEWRWCAAEQRQKGTTVAVTTRTWTVTLKLHRICYVSNILFHLSLTPAMNQRSFHPPSW